MLLMDENEDGLLGAERMAAVETTAVAKNLGVDGLTKRGSGGATGGSTEKTSEDRTRETADGRADGASDGAD